MTGSAAPLEIQWRKSSRSAGGGDCVEIAELPDKVLVRDSKDPDGPQLRFTSEAWRGFIGEVKDGGFDG